MVFCQQVNFIISPRIGITIAIILFIASCTVPHRYQKDKPFVYKSGVTLKSDLTNTAKQQLKSGLMNQIDDSLQVRTILAIRLKPPFFYYRLSKPPVFDSLYIGRSKTFMTALLNSQGYFGPTITDTFSIDTVGSQKRVSVRFNVTTGKALRLDSIGFALRTPELQLLTMESRDKSLLKKNDAYSIQNISSELERLLNIFRDNGYSKYPRKIFMQNRIRWWQPSSILSWTHSNNWNCSIHCRKKDCSQLLP